MIPVSLHLVVRSQLKICVAFKSLFLIFFGLQMSLAVFVGL